MKVALTLIVCVLLFSCDYFQPREKEEALARVGTSYLSATDLNNLGLNNLSVEDSTKIVTTYINNWIKTEAYLQHAKNELTDAQLSEIKTKVQDYERSLYTHLYESQIINTKLDTVVTSQEIEEYYNSHQADFEVNEPIIQFISLKKDSPFKVNTELKNLITNYIEKGNDAEIKEFCTFSLVDCQLDTQTWFRERTFFETFEVDKSNKIVSANNKKITAVESQDYYYLYKIIEYKKNGYYPIEFVKTKIEKNIIQKREKKYVEELRNQIIQLARDNNEIEIYESE